MYPESCTELQHYSAAGQVRLQRNQCSEAKHLIAAGSVVIFYCLGCHLGQLFWHWLMWVNHGYWGRDKVVHKLLPSAWRRKKNQQKILIVLFCFVLFGNGLARGFGNDLKCILEMLLIMIKIAAKFNKIQLNTSLLSLNLLLMSSYA